jgi:hypothetical protein
MFHLAVWKPIIHDALLLPWLGAIANERSTAALPDLSYIRHPLPWAEQSANDKSTKAQMPGKDIDPLALQGLKAATDPIRHSRSFSFCAPVSDEELGSNRQVITLFQLSEVTVQRSIASPGCMSTFVAAARKSSRSRTHPLCALYPAGKAICGDLEPGYD